MTTAHVKPPISFWIIAILALLWNLMGLLAFVGDLMFTEEMLQGLSDADRQLRAQFPEWTTIVYGIATIGGALAALLLTLRKKWAFHIFVISLVAVLVQMGYTLLVVNAIAIKGWTVAILPLIITGVGSYLVWYSLQALKNKWIY